MSNPYLDEIVVQCGTISEFARRLGVTHQSANKWVKRGFVPPARALQIEVLFGIPAREVVPPSLREIAELLNG